MLERAPSTDPRARQQRERRRLKQRRYRQHQREGKMVVPVKIDAVTITMLITTNWLREPDSGDRRKIGDALGAMVADAAKG